MTSTEDTASVSGADNTPDEGIDDAADISLDDLEELEDELPPPPKPYVFDEGHGPLAGGDHRRRPGWRTGRP